MSATAATITLTITTQRVATRDKADEMMEWRLRNWGSYMRGMPVYLRYCTMKWPETTDAWEQKEPREPEPIAADAEAIEIAMCAVRVLRPPLFTLALSRYIARADIVMACERLRCSPRTYYERLGRLYAFLEGRLVAANRGGRQ